MTAWPFRPSRPNPCPQGTMLGHILIELVKIRRMLEERDELTVLAARLDRQRAALDNAVEDHTPTTPGEGAP